MSIIPNEYLLLSQLFQRTWGTAKERISIFPLISMSILHISLVFSAQPFLIYLLSFEGQTEIDRKNNIFLAQLASKLIITYSEVFQNNLVNKFANSFRNEMSEHFYYHFIELSHGQTNRYIETFGHEVVTTTDHAKTIITKMSKAIVKILEAISSIYRIYYESDKLGALLNGLQVGTVLMIMTAFFSMVLPRATVWRQIDNVKKEGRDSDLRDVIMSQQQIDAQNTLELERKNIHGLHQDSLLHSNRGFDLGLAGDLWLFLPRDIFAMGLVALSALQRHPKYQYLQTLLQSLGNAFGHLLILDLGSTLQNMRNLYESIYIIINNLQFINDDIISASRLNDFTFDKAGHFKKSDVITGQHSLRRIEKISFENVSFDVYVKNKLERILNDIKLTITKPQIGTQPYVVKISGETGSGKSTLANLLARQTGNYEGLIKINDIDIKAYDKASFSGQVAYISQHPHIRLGKTLAENILYGYKRDPSQKAYFGYQEADFNRAHEICAKMKLGKKWSHEKLNRVSGGERLRIAIAQALMKKPSLYILDESLSQLDPVTQKAVWHALYEAAENAIILIIHHGEDLKLVNDAIKIDSGEVVSPTPLLRSHQIGFESAKDSVREVLSPER